MTLKASALTWSTWNWLSAAATDVGMRLNEAFYAFAGEVNANPGMANPLSILRNHASATGTTRFGYVWRLGHPTAPVLLRFSNSAKRQGWDTSSSSAQFQLALESAYSDDSSTDGYGSFSSTLFQANAGLTHYGPDGAPSQNWGGLLLVLMDTTAGREFFSYTLGATGAEIYQSNQTLVLFRTPHSSNWNVYVFIAEVYGGQSYSELAYLAINDGYASAFLAPIPPSGNSQQLVSGLGLMPAVQVSGSFSTSRLQPRLQLPGCFWLGTNAHSEPRRLARTSSPAGNGTFYQLGAAGSASWSRDLWFLLPSGTPAAMPGWGAVSALPWTTLSDRLSFCPLAPLEQLLLGGTAQNDFVTDWPGLAAGAPGVAQHPFFSLQPQGSGGGGGAGAGSSRPSTGVLWPRRTR
jgi:hypothetical protein